MTDVSTTCAVPMFNVNGCLRPMTFFMSLVAGVLYWTNRNSLPEDRCDAGGHNSQTAGRVCLFSPNLNALFVPSLSFLSALEKQIVASFGSFQPLFFRALLLVFIFVCPSIPIVITYAVSYDSPYTSDIEFPVCLFVCLFVCLLVGLCARPVACWRVRPFVRLFV